MISYQDYLNYARNQMGSEGSNEFMSQERWNALNPNQQWGLLGGNFGIGSDDSRYADLKPQVGGDPGRAIQIGTSAIADSDLVDPSRQARGEGWFAHSEDNQTPDYQDRIGMSGDILRMFLATGAGITGLAGLMGAFGGPFTSALGASPGQGFGTIGYNGAAGILDGAGALGSAASNAASSAPYGTDAVEAAEWFGGPGAATNPSPGLFGSAAGASGAAASAGGLLGGEGLSGLLSGALKNPLQALGLLNMARGMFGNNGSQQNGSSGNSSGGLFDLPKGNRGPWTPNPFTQQQIANFRYTGG